MTELHIVTQRFPIALAHWASDDRHSRPRLAVMGGGGCEEGERRYPRSGEWSISTQAREVGRGRKGRTHGKRGKVGGDNGRDEEAGREGRKRREAGVLPV